MPKGLIAKATTTVNAPANKVWSALTSAAALKEFMFGSNITSNWTKGSKIVWKGEWQGRPYEDKGVVLEAEPGKKLEYTHFSPLMGKPDTPENYHTVTIELSGDERKTRVSLSQDNNATEEARMDSTRNWEQMLSSLKKYVER